MKRKIKIIHILVNLTVGGAEMALLKLLSRLDRTKYDCKVISLKGIEEMGKRLIALGIPVESLNLRLSNFFISFYRLIKIIKREKPNIVQTWMYHADLLGGLASRLVGIKNIIWGIRNQYSKDSKNLRFRTRLIAKVCSYLSFWLPKYIVACSDSSKFSHVALGYDQKKIKVIYNGVDLKRFTVIQERINFKGRKKTQAVIHIGTLGRYNSVKDYPNLLQAAKIVIEKNKNVVFQLAGRELDSDNNELIKLINRLGLIHYVELLGQLDNPADYLQTLDIFVLSSLSEGFPNVLIEAMACGVPCISTNIGDCKHIIQNTGIVVEAQNSNKLAEAILNMIDYKQHKRALLGKAARNRVEKKFDIQTNVAEFEILYHSL